MPKHDNEFMIKTYGACTNGYGSFLEENVIVFVWVRTCSCMVG